MVYELPEYAYKIAKCCVNTLNNRIKNNQLPSNHIVYKGKKGQRTVIEIIHGSENCIKCNNMKHAAIEYHKRGGGSYIAAELCVKFDINTVDFFKIMNVR